MSFNGIQLLLLILGAERWVPAGCRELQLVPQTINNADMEG